MGRLLHLPPHPSRETGLWERFSWWRRRGRAEGGTAWNGVREEGWQRAAKGVRDGVRKGRGKKREELGLMHGMCMQLISISWSLQGLRIWVCVLIGGPQSGFGLCPFFPVRGGFETLGGFPIRYKPVDYRSPYYKSNSPSRKTPPDLSSLSILS